MKPMKSEDCLPGNELGRKFLEKYRQALQEIAKYVIELTEPIELVFIGMLADGHVILEGQPGVGKTLAINTIAHTVAAKRSRIQFSPETLPSDIYYSIGSFDGESGKGKTVRDTTLVPGPIFTQILIGDEINRAISRVHAALLEALEEKQVTLEGQTISLGAFYFFMATQNPVESMESTNELPEALRERLMLMINIPYPTPELLQKIAVHDTRLKNITEIFSVEEIVQMQNAIFEQYVLRCEAGDPVIDYIQRVITGIHEHKAVAWGPGIRAGQDLTRSAAVHAFLHGQERITFADVQAMAYPALRFKFKRDARVSRKLSIASNDEVIRQVLAHIAITERR